MTYKDGNKGRICRVDVALIDKKKSIYFSRQLSDIGQYYIQLTSTYSITNVLLNLLKFPRHKTCDRIIPVKVMSIRKILTELPFYHQCYK